MKKVINSPHAPAPVGAYSQAVSYGGVLYCSGQIAIDPATGKLVLDNIEDETTQVLKNMDAVLKAAGSDKNKVLKCTVFVADISLFDRINAVYGAYFGEENPPARELVQVAKLPKGVNIEISALAAV